jgi:hypothetical protein
VKIDILQLEFIDSNLRSIVMMVESKFEVEIYNYKSVSYWRRWSSWYSST